MPTDWNKWFKCEHPPALQKEWVLRTTWTDCPLEIQEIIENLWKACELGNDNYVYKCTINSLREGTDGVDVQPLIDYLIAHGVQLTDPVMLHLWW